MKRIFDANSRIDIYFMIARALKSPYKENNRLITEIFRC